jgi:dTMP kinase
MKKGLFITFEGVEGCGKTTHAKLLFEYLGGKKIPCIYTREPGGTKLGEEVRNILLNSRSVNISDRTELFLFEACRSQITQEIIKPALERGVTVICDRYTDATLAYQGYGGGLDALLIETLNTLASGALVPDLTLLLDVDTPEGLERASLKGIDRIESKDVAYHEKVRRGYLELAKKYPDRIRVIRVDSGISEVQARIRKEVSRAVL